MIIKIVRHLHNRLYDDLLFFNRSRSDDDGNDGHSDVWGDYIQREKADRKEDLRIDLSKFTKQECKNLYDLFARTDLHGARVVASDLRKYLQASADGPESIRVRTLKQACWAMELYIASLEMHCIFAPDEYGGGSHSGYYVAEVEYHPPDLRKDYFRPEYMTADIWWVENDKRRKSHVTWYAADCVNMTPIEALHRKGFTPEVPRLLQTLAAETERYYDEVHRIGDQYTAKGLGLCDIDNALISREEERRSKHENIDLDRFGPTKVVIDVRRERAKDDDSDSNDRDGPDPYRWHRWNMRFHSPTEDDIVRHMEANEDTVEPFDIDIPVHPLVPVFSLQYHERCRVHINNLTRYVYDTSVGERLVLPQIDRDMVNLLVNHASNNFKDIVEGKGRSMNILSGGPPGTGKTATAEIFAEYKERPLYTIQCAQLGVSATEVESNLHVVMTRANRWGAILLLDEADVYIGKRGTDLNQNAIVGAFLRVLEYANCILFMTTNMPDAVDDAVTSRCIARLTYSVPSVADQARIWRILSDLNELPLADSEIAKIVKAFPNLSGRDIKNVLKLASFIAGTDAITLATAQAAMRFKPTETYSK